MNPLATILASIVRARIEQLEQSPNAEIRFIFHGPPLEILSEAFHILVGEMRARGIVFPVVLQVPALGAGQRNPAIGSSGWCDETHLLNLRNSPTKPTFVALVPPGQHSNRSVASTTDEFGMSASNRTGNVPFEAWWADDFVQEIVEIALNSANVPHADREGARLLIREAASAADVVDLDRTQRRAVWRVLSRVCAISPTNAGLPFDKLLSLSCGVPPTGDGKLAAKEQIATLNKIADALSDGFSAGIARAREMATDSDDIQALDDFLTHLRSVCERRTTFDSATAAYYAPANGLNIQAPPKWWNRLTVEKWSELLAEESAAIGDIRMICTNGIMPFHKGMPVIVEDQVELRFETVGQVALAARVSIERTPASPSGKLLAQIKADSEDPFIDTDTPVHRSPLRYVASADSFKPGAIKVVSLKNWAHGVYVACRLARKLAPPKKRKTKSGPELETHLLLPGAGRYELIVFVSPGVDLNECAFGNTDDSAERGDAPIKIPVRQSRSGQYQIEVEVDGGYQVDIEFKRPTAEGQAEEASCRVFLSIAEVQQHGCRSEFERLIRANRRSIKPSEARTIVQPDRNARSSSLQDWMLSSELVSRSYLPIVLADDYVDAWVQPTWTEKTGPIFSKGRFLKDPRPDPLEFDPPEGFVAVREKIARRIRGSDDETGLVETAQLGKWILADHDFKSLVEQYLGLYQTWLTNAPDVACWIDVAAITSLELDGRTLARIPEAVLLSPLHPVRLAWHAVAQSVMLQTDEAERPCPAVSIFDPDCVPDVVNMALRSPLGIDRVDYVAVENGSDYWSVLWNGAQLRGLADRSRRAPFGNGFGISVGGISAGFSASQVGRALDDVSGLLAAKPVLSIAVASAGGTTDACNEGLIDWCIGRFEQDDRQLIRPAAGPRRTVIYDDREVGSRPDDATIANLSEDTESAVRWFGGQPRNAVPDLGIIAQLDMSEPNATVVPNRTPVGHAALIRHRIRRQLPNAFLSESRQALPSPASTDSLADKVSACVAAMENVGDQRCGLSFAPNVNAIHDMLERRQTDFVAVSSSAIDPACFLGGWLEGAYLWDYDLPSYSHRAGDTNGYYLLSRIKEADREALRKALSALPGCSNLDDVHVQQVLLEVARRGIPTIRGLAGDNTGATGDLGLFLAVRLLQDRFRSTSQARSLLSVIGGSEEEVELAIIVPVDPFRGHLSDLALSIPAERKDASLARPDLLVVGIRLASGRVRISLTPIEVKCRPGSIFPSAEVADALDQAKSLSRLLKSMSPQEGQHKAWALAFQHLLLSLIGFGMRVYSQHPDVLNQEQWSSFHERVATAILSEEAEIDVDMRGRLIIIDDNPRSTARDRDGDGFDETITIGIEDAGIIVGGDPASYYDSVRAQVGDWQLMPRDTTKHEEEMQRAPEEVALVGPDVEKAESIASAMLAVGQPSIFAISAAAQPSTPNTPDTGVTLQLGMTIDGFQPRNLSLNISDTRLNHMNMGVVGDLGTGKTQLLKSLILQISEATSANRGIRPRFLIFDYKRDYSSPDFVKATGARVIRPQRLPINLFDIRTMEETAAPWLQRYLFFSDVLDKIYSGIGPVQRDKLKRAIRAAYDRVRAGEQPTLYDVNAAYLELVEGKPDSVSAIMGDLVDMEVFEPDPRKTQPFGDFLDGVVVISLDALGQDDRSKNMLVAVMLNLFYENMLRTPKRPFVGQNPQLRAIDSYLLVDEADNIMRYEFEVLHRLLLQGREFGAGIILASQYLRHFKVNATDYRDPLLTWFIHKVPNVTPGELSALGFTGSVAELSERVKLLPNHHCLYKSFDISGDVIRGLPFFELMTSRSLE
jgi:hypothetical protein